MTNSKLINALWLPTTILALYLAAISFRPLLPIDETRYMTVAWEMFLQQGWLSPLTLNFEPYHHKPPLLFWLINLSWSIFGISRWAGLIPIAILSYICILLTGKLGSLIFPEIEKDKKRLHLIMAGSLPFLIYGTLVMFDVTLTVFVLLSLINLVKYSRTLQLRYAMYMGIFLGLGVLTKGPVAYLYVMYPALLAPLWMKAAFPNPAKWGAGCLLALITSTLPVLFWLIPILQQSDNDFAFWLLWNQTAGRVTGNFDDAHIRPFSFYLPLLPLMFMPWLLLPSLWKQIGRFKLEFIHGNEGGRFLYCWSVPVFISFCLISGKQPHYLVPLLPSFALILFMCLKETPIKKIAVTASISILMVIGGQAIASQSILKKYNLEPIAEYVEQHPEHEWAFVRNYHGEIGFLAGLLQPIDNLDDKSQLPEWLLEHPSGFAVVKFETPAELSNYRILFEQSYRGKKIGIVASK